MTTLDLYLIGGAYAAGLGTTLWFAVKGMVRRTRR